MKKLWQTSGSVDSFAQTFTVGDDPVLDARFLPYEVKGSLAHALGLVKIGLLTSAEYDSVKVALDKLLANSSSFVIKPEQEDIHTAVEQYLTSVVGDAGKKIHTGRSRNDQVQTNIRLYLKEQLSVLHGLVCDAALEWANFASKYEGALMPGYTHLQRAMPTTVAHWAASHAEGLLESLGALESAYNEVDQCPLGSAAGFGVPLPLDREYVASLLGFSRVQRNTLRVQTSRPRIDAAVVSALALLARDIGVLAADLSLFATAEFGFVKLGEDFTTGSSIMPQKRNPDVVELMRAKACLFPGWLAQILAVGSLPSGYHRDYQITKGPLLAAVDTALALVEGARRLPGALTVDVSRCRSFVTRELTATQKALTAVASGVPFRDAYRAVADEARSSVGGAVGDQEIELPKYEGGPGNVGVEALIKEVGKRRIFTQGS